jgi:3-methyladenine DNA glycosylase AlkD
MAELSRSSTAAEVLAHLRGLGSEDNRQGMRRYGIRIDRALGISHGEQRRIARQIGRDHERALALWDSGITEARLIASLTVDPERFTVEQARAWAGDLDSWDIVDGVSDRFAAHRDWHVMILEFAGDERAFVRRTAFAMIASASVHRKTAPDETFARLLPIIRAHAADPRNFVWKAASWALRSIGKRSPGLRTAALELARNLASTDDSTARRIGRETIRELGRPSTVARIEKRHRR